MLRFAVLALMVARILSDQGGFTASTFKQKDYHVTPERAEMVRYDKQYFSHASLISYKYNRTCTVLNLTMVATVEFGNRLIAAMQAYKFLSNEYRYFPLRFQIHVCDAFSMNVAGIVSNNKCGNLRSCPIIKGVISLCKWTPDESQLPPLIPSGRYMGEMQFLYLDKEVLVFKVYVEVTRPVV